jgi:hypothetical protein
LQLRSVVVHHAAALDQVAQKFSLDVFSAPCCPQAPILYHSVIGRSQISSSASKILFQ